MREISIDTETTGLNAKDGDRIFEIGCVEIVDKKVTEKSFHVYINPERELSIASKEITGLTDDFVKQFDVFSQIADEFLDFIKEDRLVIHNAKFDLGFLNMELERIGLNKLSNEVVDTLEIAKLKYPGSPATLDALCRKFKIDRSKRTKHGALIDAELLAEVYISLSVVFNQRDIFSSQEQEEGSRSLEVNYENKPYIAPRDFPLDPEDLQNHELFMQKLKR